MSSKETKDKQLLEVTKPPSSEEIEIIILGSIFLDDKLFKELFDGVDISDFNYLENKEIFKAMLSLYSNNKKIDYAMVLEKLEADGKGKLVSADYVLGLSDSVPSVANFKYYVTQLKEYAQLRKLYDLGKYLVTTNIKGTDIEEIINKIKSTISLVEITNNIEITNVKENIEDWLSALYKPEEKDNLYKFGYKVLDSIVQLKRSNLQIIAARPSVGKSAFALNIAKNLCFQKKKVLFISLEMSDIEIYDRLVSNVSGVASEHIKHKTLTKEAKHKIEEAVKLIKELQWWVYDKGSISISHLSSLARKMTKEYGLDAIVVDYLQLVHGSKANQNRTREVGEVSRGLKSLAQELKIPIIALSQLNRASIGQDRKPKEPQMHDLRESGDIEQDANVIMMLHSDDVDDKFTKEKYLKLFIRKNRSGKNGTINLSLIGDTMTFVEKEHINGSFVEVEQDNLLIDNNDLDLPF